ncbi:OTU domain-containing protein 4-like [Sphaeramia orbicularis]|uniref:OTU domain-containing protein 4-like n=1 Tax=Sphaeramia orbicularis TaxID=375764 RepID=UPI00117E2F42|nr:OTU domain-containing protein 4-like [Sphaeramia orbicularis]
MDGGGSMRSNEERVAEKQMDDYLKTIGLHRKKIAKDGSCLFRAVAEQVLYCQSYHTEVRAQCVEFLKKNRDSYEAFIEGDFEDYLCKLQDQQQWVGEVEINALAVMYKRDFLIYQEPNKPAVHITDNNFKDKVRLCFLNGNHYDSVYPSHMKGAAVCQSILYELLYTNVFKVDRSVLAGYQRTGRHFEVLSDDSMAACISSDESDVDSTETQRLDNGTSTTTTKSRGRGRGRHLSDRVRRSLNPTLFRNIEFDVWQRSKKAQQKLDFCIAAGMQYAVGDRCQVRLEGRTYNATIKEVPPNNSAVTVYVEELGRRQVPLWSLRPVNEDGSWSFVNRDKRLGNGHGEWEQRGRGRGRGRSTATSSAVAQATASSPGGRVLKQHSWPPQATAEEPGGSRSSRKSLSTADPPPFGLTEEERLAKEEERNVALVEIQLRDEHSFPALSVSACDPHEGGKKKGGEKKRSQQSVKRPVEDLKAPSPHAGEQPKSVSPPLTAPPKAPPSAPPFCTLCKPDSRHWTECGFHRAADTTVVSSLPAGSSSSPPISSSPKPPTAPSSAFLLPTSSPSLVVSPPTFIAPIAPSPVAAQGFVLSVSPPTHPTHPLTQPTCVLALISSSSSSLIRHACQVDEAPPPPIVCQTLEQFSPHLSLPKRRFLSPRTKPDFRVTDAEPDFRVTDAEPEPDFRVTDAEPDFRITDAEPEPDFRVTDAEPDFRVTDAEPDFSAPDAEPDFGAPNAEPKPGCCASHPVLSSESNAFFPPQTSDQLHPHPPHPSQVPLPSQSLSSVTIPSLPTQTPTTDKQRLLPSSSPGVPSSPSRPSPSHPPQFQPVPGTVPLQQLSQLYLDPLYPGFPQKDNGEPALPPPYSTNKSGDDLPQDVSILRFFFNLGVKAYSMPMFYPYVYLFPLQHAYNVQPKPPPAPLSHPPLPSFRCPPGHHEPYPSVSRQFDRSSPQAPPAERPPPQKERTPGWIPPLSQPPSCTLPCPPPLWHQPHMQTHRNPSYPVVYPSPQLLSYPTPPTSQCYPPV